MSINSLEWAQLASALADYSRVFSARNPGQDQLAAGLQDSARGMVQAEIPRMEKKKKEKKAKKHAPWAAAIDTVALVAAPFTGGMSLQFAKPVKTAFGVEDGNQHGIAKATGAAVDMGTSFGGMGMGGGMAGGGIGDSLAGAIKGAKGSDVPKTSGGELPYADWMNGMGGSQKHAAAPSAPFTTPVPPSAPPQTAAVDPYKISSMSPEERLSYAMGRKRMGAPLSEQEFAMYPRGEWESLKSAGIERPKYWQMLGHYVKGGGGYNSSMAPQRTFTYNGYPYRVEDMY